MALLPSEKLEGNIIKVASLTPNNTSQKWRAYKSITLNVNIWNYSKLAIRYTLYNTSESDGTKYTRFPGIETEFLKQHILDPNASSTDILNLDDYCTLYFLISEQSKWLSGNYIYVDIVDWGQNIKIQEADVYLL